jgi:hypothetical protein
MKSRWLNWTACGELPEIWNHFPMSSEGFMRYEIVMTLVYCYCGNINGSLVSRYKWLDALPAFVHANRCLTSLASSVLATFSAFKISFISPILLACIPCFETVLKLSFRKVREFNLMTYHKPEFSSLKMYYSSYLFLNTSVGSIIKVYMANLTAIFHRRIFRWMLISTMVKLLRKGGDGLYFRRYN